MIKFIIFALAASAVTGSIFRRQNATAHGVDANADDRAYRLDYLHTVCNPFDNTNSGSIKTPCNAIYAIEVECTFGPPYTDLTMSEGAYGVSSGGPTMLDVETQRICMCESQFFDQLNGCNACYRAHGGVDGQDSFSDEILASMSSSYCAASATPTVGGAEYMLSFVTPTDAVSSSPNDPSATSTFSDPLNNQTDVSLYFAPSATGTAAYIVALPTASGNASSVLSYSNINIVNGQIRPTAVADLITASGSSFASPSSTGSDPASTTDNASGGGASGSAVSAASASGPGSASSVAGAVKTASIRKEALAGILGLAGLVALL